MWKSFIIGSLTTIVVLIIGSFLFILLGGFPANADSTPPAIENWIAKTTLSATLRRHASEEPNPLPVTDENLISGIKIYGDNCAICHGAMDAKPSNIATGLYQKAPQFAKDGVEDDPEGHSYWIIKHGIRFTGMPAFPDFTDRQIWLLALFLKHMNSLPPAAASSWKNVPSSGSP